MLLVTVMQDGNQERQGTLCGNWVIKEGFQEHVDSQLSPEGWLGLDKSGGQQEEGHGK